MLLGYVHWLEHHPLGQPQTGNGQHAKEAVTGSDPAHTFWHICTHHSHQEVASIGHDAADSTAYPECRWSNGVRQWPHPGHASLVEVWSSCPGWNPMAEASHQTCAHQWCTSQELLDSLLDSECLGTKGNSGRREKHFQLNIKIKSSKRTNQQEHLELETRYTPGCIAKSPQVFATGISSWGMQKWRQTSGHNPHAYVQPWVEKGNMTWRSLGVSMHTCTWWTIGSWQISPCCLQPQPDVQEIASLLVCPQDCLLVDTEIQLFGPGLPWSSHFQKLFVDLPCINMHPNHGQWLLWMSLKASWHCPAPLGPSWNQIVAMQICFCPYRQWSLPEDPGSVGSLDVGHSTATCLDTGHPGAFWALLLHVALWANPGSLSGAISAGQSTAGIDCVDLFSSSWYIVSRHFGIFCGMYRRMEWCQHCYH